MGKSWLSATESIVGGGRQSGSIQKKTGYLLGGVDGSTKLKGKWKGVRAANKDKRSKPNPLA